MPLDWRDLKRLLEGVRREGLAPARAFGDTLTKSLTDLKDGVEPGAEDPVLGMLLGGQLTELVRKVGWNCLVINPGSTSTKVSVYNGLKMVAHDEVHLDPGKEDGVEERVNQITAWFESLQLRPSDLTGIAARGGFVAPVPGGTYRVVPKMLEDLAAAPYQHASNLSVPIALGMGELAGPDTLVTTTDPVTVDELDLVYRLTGSPRIRNDALAVHYLNHRATAELTTQLLREDQNTSLITCHMGGGMSAARHEQGRMVQVAQAFGTMPSANRAGALPLHQVIRLLESHELALEDLRADVMSTGGLLGLAGTNDFKAFLSFARAGASPEQRKKIELISEFFAIRVAGCILELTAQLRPVDAVVLTGGLANDAGFCQRVAGRIQLVMPIARLPGSVEQQALAAGLLRACADPASLQNYHENRDRLRAARKQEDELLDIPVFERGSQKHQVAIAPARIEDILFAARPQGALPTVAIVGADNEEALLAAKLASLTDESRLARFLLVGPYSRISQLAWELDVAIDDDQYVLVDAADPVGRTMELIEAGLADTLMKGSVMTADLLKGYLGYLRAKGLSGRGLRLSHLGLFEIPGRRKLVGVTDAAINTYPNVEVRGEILENALDALHLLGFSQPRVAVVSAVEKPSQAVASSIEGQAIATSFQHRQDLIIEGPLSVDLALSPHSAKEKGYHGRIRGNADLLLVPDIDTGNAIYKAFTVTSGAVIAGAVIGGAVPLILTSRGDSSRSKLASIALALALLQKQKTGRAV